MSDKGSVYQKGGGGTNFEQLVQTAFVVTLIVHGNFPGIRDGILKEVAFQVTNRGFETDDLMAIAESPQGTHKILAQIKHEIIISSKNDVFNEVIAAFWKDYNNEMFDKNNDRLVLIKGGLTKDERNHVKMLLNWAKCKATANDFISEVKRISEKDKWLGVFRASLQLANNNTALTDDILWAFLKCVDLLDYDFQNDGSVDKTNSLNIIKLAKSRTSNKSEFDIWDNILSFVSGCNPNGGSVTLDSIKNEDFFLQFDNARLDPARHAVEKLLSDSKSILASIRNTIGDYHLPRTQVSEELSESINRNSITIVTGKPGVGKSAIVKDALSQILTEDNCFVFRADQFSVPVLSNVFSRLGLTEPLQEIFFNLSLSHNKIIFIDSLEKLLESDPECAFRELLALLRKYPHIKLIATSRDYAHNLLLLKFGIEYGEINIVDIPPLKKDEIKCLAKSFPVLTEVLKNDKISDILACPKYIDFVLKSSKRQNDNLSKPSLRELKNNLWNSLVKDYLTTIDGMPGRRESTFIDIAVNRAKKMTLYYQPPNPDDAALEKLKRDEIIVEDNNNSHYSPAHDILEDWALEKYISQVYDRYSNIDEMLANIGTEPAMRRAFRLWIEDMLIDGYSNIEDVVDYSLNYSDADKYWADEILVAIFKSNDCSTFFEKYKNQLLENKCLFLKRCLNLIRTCCKESFVIGNQSHLMPIGSGWKGMMCFLQNNLNIDTPWNSVVGFLMDWYYRLLFQYDNTDNDELIAAKAIVIHYIQKIEKCDSYSELETYKTAEVINILLDLVDVSKEEIYNLVIESLEESDSETCGARHLHEKIIESCLFGIGHFRLLKEMPELIIQVAERHWKYVPPKESDYPNDISPIFFKHSLFDEECWGFKYDMNYFPSGVYKTPFYTMLLVQPRKALDFIIDFLNYSVEFYVHADCDYKHEIGQIEMELNDGTIVKKWGSIELWESFRGLSVTNYLMESLLMGLEKYLLEISERNTDNNIEAVQFVFDHILKNSNNVAPIAVLASIAMAYPNVPGKSMLPLFKNKEFYDWDRNRALQESQALAPLDPRNSSAQKERYELNRLPHRTMYKRGLEDFIVLYQFNIKTLNKELFAIFDKFKLTCDDDVIWRKSVTEMDSRNYQVGEFDTKLGGFPVMPKYEPDVKAFIEDNHSEQIDFNRTMYYSSLLREVLSGKKIIDYSQWCECHDYYMESHYRIFDSPVSLAKVGLDTFSESLLEEQREWCTQTISDTIDKIVKDIFSPSFSSDMDYNIMEKDVALSSFHLLLQNVDSDKGKYELIKMMILLLLSQSKKQEISHFIKYIQSEFNKHCPNETLIIRNNLFEYAFFKQKYNPREIRKTIIANFLDKIDLTDKPIDMSIEALKNCDVSILIDCILITPYKECGALLQHIIPVIIEALYQDKKAGGPRLSYIAEELSGLEQYLASYFLSEEIAQTKPVFISLINATSQRNDNNPQGSINVLKFLNYTIDFIVLKFYDSGNMKGQIDNNTIEKHFWSLWNVLYEELPESGIHPLTKKLMLDVDCLQRDIAGKPNLNNWIVLKKEKLFYKKVMLTKGRNNLRSAVNIMSTVGGYLLPEGVDWIAEIIRSNEAQAIWLNSIQGDRLIMRLYNDHIAPIKDNKRLMDNYIYLLNHMIDLGSSNAYYIRENVITYKKAV